MKKKLIALALGVTAFGGVFAAAAALNVTSTTLGAGEATVASCDTNGISTAYTSAYSATSGTFEVSAVNLSGIATTSCDGKALTVVLAGAANAALANVTITHASGATDTVTIPSGVKASEVVGISVQLNG